VDLAEAVRAVYPDRPFESGGRDPHIWLSPRRAQVMVQKIAEEMAALDPQNKEQYEQNAEHYIKELQSIDQQLAEIFAPFNDRKFFVFHPAFGYLADDYGLLMYSLEQNGKEATPQHLQEMIDLAKAEGARAVFCQAEIDDKQSEAFAAEIGAFSVLLTPLSPDYTDSLLDMAHKITEALR
jgi:zinc transport system substrate-binding protein